MKPGHINLKQLIWMGLSVAVLVATGYAGAGDKTPSAADQAATEDRPAMWRIADADSTIYLFGTLHLLPSDIQWKSDRYEAAMKTADTTITEADTASPEALAAVQAAVRQYGFNPPGVTLSETLGDKRATQFSSFADKLGMPMSALEPLRPWLALLSLAQIVYQKAGFNLAQGVEASILTQAKAEGDTLAYLEDGSTPDQGTGQSRRR